MKAPLRHLRSASALLLAALAAGCAGDSAEQLFVRPGRFDYMTCPELVRTRESALRREQELKTLFERAEKDSGVGVLMAEASYRGELLRAQGELKMAAEVIQRMNCPPDTPPAPPQAKSTPKRR